MRVLKFGGACVASRERLRRVVEIVARTPHPRVVTVSALAGVTDALHAAVAAGDGVACRLVGDLWDRHAALLPAGAGPIDSEIRSDLERLEADLAACRNAAVLAVRERVLSAGERLAARLVAAWLRSCGIAARPYPAEQAGIRCDGQPGAAEIDLARTRNEVAVRLLPALAAGTVPVVTGYYGIGPRGEVATFGRSGTDYTATALGHALAADRVELWKEVPGFREADPRLLPAARTIARLSYDEAVELAHSGARVIHPRALEPAQANGMPIHVLGLEDPDAPGTLISPEVSRSTGALTALTCRPRLAVLRIRGRSASRQHETMAAVAGRLGAAGIDILGTTSAQTSLAVLVDAGDEPAALAALRAPGAGEPWSTRSTLRAGLVCAVGHGLAETRGMVARLLCAVVRAGIEVDLVCAGASTAACHLAVAEGEVERAARAIYREFFERAPSGRRLCHFTARQGRTAGGREATGEGSREYTIA